MNKGTEKKLRMAFMGFRHGHIFSVYKAKRADVEIAGACEEHAETRAALKKSAQAEITHENYEKMLDELDFDILAVGDYYARRGAILIEALKRGKHVISDKPICVRLAELDEIENLARQKRLAVGCQLDQRSGGTTLAMRDLIRAGALGEIHAIACNGQHPLNYRARPGWYFEEGKHGGTINDIAIHAFNSIPWMTGLRFVRVNAARNWNARLKEAPHFKDAAQFMLTMDNGCGVLGDVSYFAPDSFGYSLPQYWRFTIWGSAGLIEANHKDGILYRNGEKEPRPILPPPGPAGFYFDSFLREIRGQSAAGDLMTAEVIESSRNTLLTQKAADENLHDVAL
ncbi:MAG: Gfo/Idh/MocA family oxidoreductase [Kiritimatiellae bacterium]|nr:Gfo/Idh/MocA family oxidoreductase [Kiritimatiellia bacterium]